MRIQAYTQRAVSATITVQTRRDEAAPSSLFVHAKLHDDYAARIGALLREHKHIGETALAYPATRRLQTYFPKSASQELYAVRQLLPAGTQRAVDGEWHLEILTIRYELALALLPAAFTSDEEVAEHIAGNVAAAFKGLFAAANLPNLFVFGDEGARPENGSMIDVVCDLGAAGGRQGVEVSVPAS